MHCNASVTVKEHTVGSLGVKEGKRVLVEIAYANLDVSSA